MPKVSYKYEAHKFYIRFDYSTYTCSGLRFLLWTLQAFN